MHSFSNILLYMIFKFTLLNHTALPSNTGNFWQKIHRRAVWKSILLFQQTEEGNKQNHYFPLHLSLPPFLQHAVFTPVPLLLGVIISWLKTFACRTNPPWLSIQTYISGSFLSQHLPFSPSILLFPNNHLVHNSEGTVQLTEGGSPRQDLGTPLPFKIWSCKEGQYSVPASNKIKKINFRKSLKHVFLGKPLFTMANTIL